MATHPSRRASICDTSEGGTHGGSRSAVSHDEPVVSARAAPTARFNTQHQMGTVLLSESGYVLPVRVESTIITSLTAAASATCRLRREREKSHLPEWPSVDLK